MRKELKSIGIGVLLLAPLAGLAQIPSSVERKPIFGQPTPTPTPPQPAQTIGYVFHLNSFQVMDTRSYHEDTVIAGIGLIINGTPQNAITHQLGNFNNGNFNFQQKGLQSMQASIGPNDKFVFMFQLYNNGAHHSPNTDQLQAYIDRDLLNYGKSTGGAGNPSGNSIASIIPAWQVVFPSGKGGTPESEAGLNLIVNVMSGGAFSALKGIFEGCDGPLAFGLIEGTGKELNLRVPAQGPLVIAGDFKGTHLKLGAPCNRAGSHYGVTVMIARGRENRGAPDSQKNVRGTLKRPTPI